MKKGFSTQQQMLAGYKHVRIGKPQTKATLWKVHQLIYAAFNPEYDRKKFGRKIVIHHIDHDKTNNRLDNLELINAADHLSLHMKLYWQNNPNKGRRRMTYRGKPTKYALSLLEGKQ